MMELTGDQWAVAASFKYSRASDLVFAIVLGVFRA